MLGAARLEAHRLALARRFQGQLVVSKDKGHRGGSAGERRHQGNLGHVEAGGIDEGVGQAQRLVLKPAKLLEQSLVHT